MGGWEEWTDVAKHGEIGNRVRGGCAPSLTAGQVRSFPEGSEPKRWVDVEKGQFPRSPVLLTRSNAGLPRRAQSRAACSSRPTSCSRSKENEITCRRYVFMPVFIATPFTIAKIRSQPRRLLANKTKQYIVYTPNGIQ